MRSAEYDTDLVDVRFLTREGREAVEDICKQLHSKDWLVLSHGGQY